MDLFAVKAVTSCNQSQPEPYTFKLVRVGNRTRDIRSNPRVRLYESVNPLLFWLGFDEFTLLFIKLKKMSCFFTIMVWYESPKNFIAYTYILKSNGMLDGKAILLNTAFE